MEALGLGQNGRRGPHAGQRCRVVAVQGLTLDICAE